MCLQLHGDCEPIESRFDNVVFATVCKALFLTSHKAYNTRSVQTVESNVDNMNASSICKPLVSEAAPAYPVAKPEDFISRASDATHAHAIKLSNTMHRL